MSKQHFTLLIGILVFIYALALFIPIMEIDATQYASISSEMLRNKSYLQFTDLSNPYLDKPPLLFWLSSLSIKAFGNTSFAYKLMSVLVFWFGVFSLFKLTRLFYNETVTRYATLVYAGSFAGLLMTNDIRTDTILTSFIIFATWQLLAFAKTLSWKHFGLSVLGISLALLSKGPIGVIVPFCAFLPQVIFNKNWKAIFNLKWLLFPLGVGLLLLPMLIGLYNQFGWEGPKFYFWTQSFGRITGENVWKDNTGYFYLFQNVLWLLLPWTLFLILGFAQQAKNYYTQLIKKPAMAAQKLGVNQLKRNHIPTEYFSFFAFIVPLCALSLSHYKLPHYVYVCLPFASILAAIGLYSFKAHKKTSLVLSGLIIAFALFMNVVFYPWLLTYQSTSQVAFYVKENKLPINQFYRAGVYGRAMDYYLDTVIPSFNQKPLAKNQTVYIMANADEKIKLEKMAYNVEVLKTLPHKNVTRLTIEFLSPKTRKNALRYNYLLQVTSQ